MCLVLKAPGSFAGSRNSITGNLKRKNRGEEKNEQRKWEISKANKESNGIRGGSGWAPLPRSAQGLVHPPTQCVGVVTWWGDSHLSGLMYVLHPPHHSCIWPSGRLSSLSKCSSHYQFDKSNIYRKISRQNLYFQKTRFLYHLQLIVSYHIRLSPAEPTLCLLSPSLTLVLHWRNSTVFNRLTQLTYWVQEQNLGMKEHPPPLQLSLVIP